MKTITLVYWELTKDDKRLMLIDKAFVSPELAKGYVKDEQTTLKLREDLLKKQDVTNVIFKTKEIKLVE